jgi:hypothetical protein
LTCFWGQNQSGKRFSEGIHVARAAWKPEAQQREKGGERKEARGERGEKGEGRGRGQHIPDLRENAEKESGTLTESTLRFASQDRSDQ